MRFFRAVCFAVIFAAACQAARGAEAAGIDTAAFEKKISAELQGAGAKRALYYIFIDGKCAAGRIFEFGGAEGEAALGQTFAFGESSAALISLLALAMEEKGIVGTRRDASDFFSALRDSRGKIRGANIENMLAQSAGFPYLADKIPQDSSPEEFFDALAQMQFAPAHPAGYEPSAASVAAAGYALAYAFKPSMRGLKKNFALACRKFLFEPLGIEKPKFRHFDKWLFPAACFCLNAEDIAKWLACETSCQPPIASAAALDERRGAGGAAHSGGWSAVKGNTAARGCFGSGNFTIVYRLRGSRAAVSVFSSGADRQKLKKSFARLVEFINNQTRQ